MDTDDIDCWYNFALQHYNSSYLLWVFGKSNCVIYGEMQLLFTEVVEGNLTDWVKDKLLLQTSERLSPPFKRILLWVSRCLSLFFYTLHYFFVGIYFVRWFIFVVYCNIPMERLFPTISTLWVEGRDLPMLWASSMVNSLLLYSYTNILSFSLGILTQSSLNKEITKKANKKRWKFFEGKHIRIWITNNNAPCKWEKWTNP